MIELLIRNSNFPMHRTNLHIIYIIILLLLVTHKFNNTIFIDLHVLEAQVIIIYGCQHAECADLHSPNSILSGIKSVHVNVYMFCINFI